MTLTPGQRIEDGERNAYEIVGPAWEWPEQEFAFARKVFWNYRDRDRSRYEAHPGECLDVLVRIARGVDADLARARLAFELEHVLGRPDEPNLPEPIDRIDRGEPSGPLLILADPRGERLSACRETMTPGERVRLSVAIVEWLAALHAQGLVAGRFAPADFLIDSTGTWTYLTTWRIEASAAEGDRRADLAAWSEFVSAMNAHADGPGHEVLAALIERQPHVRSAPELLNAPGLARRAWSAVFR